jgi:hypothetical protein
MRGYIREPEPVEYTTVYANKKATPRQNCAIFKI